MLKNPRVFGTEKTLQFLSTRKARFFLVHQKCCAFFSDSGLNRLSDNSQTINTSFSSTNTIIIEDKSGLYHGIQSLKGQNWLLPPSIEDMIPEDHICYLVEAVVERTDFSKYDIKYSGPGHPAYHPRILCKILLQSMLHNLMTAKIRVKDIGVKRR